jgi:hypothetical protein
MSNMSSRKRDVTLRHVLDGVPYKWCAKHEAWVPETNFHSHAKASDGLKAWCKECCAQYQRDRAPEPLPRAHIPKGHGIYTIICPAGVYVGSSTNVQRRIHHHRKLLRNSRHGTYSLQAAWDYYGEATFTYEFVLPVLDPENLIEAERRVYLAYKAAGHILLNTVIPGRPVRTTEFDADVIRLYLEVGLTGDQIAAVLRCGSSSVYEVLAENNISTPGPGRRKKNFDLENAVTIWEETKSIPKTAIQLGVHSKTLITRLREAGYDTARYKAYWESAPRLP